MGFNLENLDNYKVALDDGMKIIDEEFYLVMKFGGGKYRVLFDNVFAEPFKNVSYSIEEKDWETFKRKIIKYFSEVE